MKNLKNTNGRSCTEIYAGFMAYGLDEEVKICERIHSDKFNNMDIDLILPTLKVAIDFRGGIHSAANKANERDLEKEKILIDHGYKVIVVHEAVTLDEVNDIDMNDNSSVVYTTVYRWSNSRKSGYKHMDSGIEAILNYIMKHCGVSVTYNESYKENVKNFIYVSKAA